MRLGYLPSAARDLTWVRHYDRQVSPEGAASARARILAVEALLRRNPHAGHPTHRDDVRRLPIARTPFSMVYRVTAERIEILRVIDDRAFDTGLEP